MLLAIDVGNTNIVLGVFDGDALVASVAAADAARADGGRVGLMVVGLCAHGADRSRAHRGRGHGVGRAGPDADHAGAWSTRYFGRDGPRSSIRCVNAGMPILYERPAEVGADRIANSVAAYEQYGRPSDLPLIIADLGTATTFDAVTARGEYLGGVICPGPQISADALFQRAARLPRVEVRKPARVIGHTTVGAIESGLFYGYLGMVEGLDAPDDARARRHARSASPPAAWRR